MFHNKGCNCNSCFEIKPKFDASNRPITDEFASVYFEAKTHIINLLSIIDDLLPDSNNNSIKSRKSYLKAKEFVSCVK